MIIGMKLLFFASAFIIFWAMIGYNVSLKVLKALNIGKEAKKDFNLLPDVTLMIVAHNEEKVIQDKLENALKLDYPTGKLKILVASDNSTDKTNQIVKEFIEKNKDDRIRLFEVALRKGKTNAQNEAQKTVTTEFLVMTDANSILNKNAIRELMASFTDENISYVTGRLEIVNTHNEVGSSESSYWVRDLNEREIESRIQTITAGNGALYACRNVDYFNFNPIKCHDSAMPLYYALNKKRAICNHDAIAYEKAGEVIDDEFGRKVRMNRIILSSILPDIRLINFFKYKWFSYFYFGHRTCRYLLWISHLLVFLASMLLTGQSAFFFVCFIMQLVFYSIAFLTHKEVLSGGYVRMIHYYTVTICAQWVGVYNTITGKSKPFWEKAESTR